MSLMCSHDVVIRMVVHEIKVHFIRRFATCASSVSGIFKHLCTYECVCSMLCLHSYLFSVVLSSLSSLQSSCCHVFIFSLPGGQALFQFVSVSNIVNFGVCRELT